jgi:HK97 family phage portal protein
MFGLTIQRRQKSAPGDLVTHWPSTQPGWWPLIRESFSGAWQRGITMPVQDALTHPTFWTCVTTIASDIAKGCFDLVEEDANGVSVEVKTSPFLPVLRKPNHYQNRIQFVESWIVSKLCRGNTYLLKGRDNRGIVTDLYPLNPLRVQPMVTEFGDVYYACQQDVLSQLAEASIVVPASEIIHDRMNAMYHPLVGLSPVYACGHMAMQAMAIVNNSIRLFKNGSQVGGILTAPGAISADNAKRLEDFWQANYAGPENAGKIVALGDGLKFEKPTVMSAVDAQLIDQLKWDDEKICSTFRIPSYMAGVGPAPLNNNVEALSQQYYSQCLQVLIESLELCLEEGLGVLDSGYEIEYDIDALLRMDSATKMKAATDGVKGGIYTPNEARAKFNLPPLKGGDTVYLQQQDYSIEALSKRDAQDDPFATVRESFSGPAAAAPPAPEGSDGPAPPPPAKALEIPDEAARAWLAAEVDQRMRREA